MLSTLAKYDQITEVYLQNYVFVRLYVTNFICFEIFSIEDYKILHKCKDISNFISGLKISKKMKFDLSFNLKSFEHSVFLIYLYGPRAQLTVMRNRLICLSGATDTQCTI